MPEQDSKPALVVTLTVTLTPDGSPSRLHGDMDVSIDGDQDLVERLLAHEPQLHPFVDAFRDAVVRALGADRVPGPSKRVAIQGGRYRGRA